MFKVKVIGSGSKGNCYYVKSKSGGFLLDLGVRFVDVIKAIDFRIKDIDFAFSLHKHLDHLKYWRDFVKVGIDVYMREDVILSLGSKSHRLKEFENLKKFQIGGFKILPFPVPHDVPNSGLLIQDTQTKEKLLYITDARYCKYRFKNVQTIMLEANYDEEIVLANYKAGLIPKALVNRVFRSHFSIQNAIKYLKSLDLSGTEKIILLHLSDRNSNAESFKKRVEAATGIITKIA